MPGCLRNGMRGARARNRAGRCRRTFHCRQRRWVRRTRLFAQPPRCAIELGAQLRRVRAPPEIRRVDPELFQERLAAVLGHDVLRLAPERREHGGTVGREQVELLCDQRAARQDLIVERARSQRRQKRPVRLEGNAVATRPSRGVDAGIARLRWAGRGRLIVDASHHVDDADRLMADRHAETRQLGAGEICIRTRVVENELDQHVMALMSLRLRRRTSTISLPDAIDLIVHAAFCPRLLELDPSARVQSAVGAAPAVTATAACR